MPWHRPCICNEMKGDSAKRLPPSKEEIRRVMEWLHFEEIRRLVADLIIKLDPNEFMISSSINSWADTILPTDTLQDLQSWHNNKGAIYKILCQTNSEP